MKYNFPKLFIKIDNSKIFFIVADLDEHSNLSLLDELILPIERIYEDKAIDYQKITNQIKKYLLKIEERINFTFKEAIIILNIFNISFLNISGYKNLNGTQVSKENITYIINSLKSCIDENEREKKILHIFNTKYQLDKKKSDNIPIGLFGDFYSHELSFNLIEESEFKNLKAIFDNCNIKIKKIITESFVRGALISDNINGVSSFSHIQFNKEDCKISYFENDSIKFEQKFKFGTDLILKDISKVTKLKDEIVSEIIKQNIFSEKNCKNELIEQKFFSNQNYRKITKSLILEISKARINEFSQIIFLKNVNFKKFLEKKNEIYLEISDLNHLNCFKEIFRQSFSSEKKFQVNIVDKPNLMNLVEVAFKIAEYGWKTEAIPVFKEKTSYFTKIFRSIFD